MSGVFQNIYPPSHHRPASVDSPRLNGAGGEQTRWVERGWGVNILEDVSTLWVLGIYESLADTHECGNWD
jgi:hypothetical protein